MAYSPLTLASLRMLPCRTHCPRPSMCIMYGCGTACGITLFARYCHLTPRQKPPKVGSGGFGDGAPPGAPKPTSGGFWRGLTRQYRANRVVSWAVPHPYMMHMLGRGQWVRQGSMRSDARVSGEYATKGLVGAERIGSRALYNTYRTVGDLPHVRMWHMCGVVRPYTNATAWQVPSGPQTQPCGALGF